LSGILLAAVKAQDCAPPTITVASKNYNIFSPEQEMVLGELTYERLSGDMRFVKDPQLVAYVNAIGEKLIRHLPPTGLRFKFFIVDIAEANAFNVPGGYVFLSRKLIGFAGSEDELAGVIAHELGHAVVRHGASDFSELLKKVLNVTQVGDRKDIADKYNLLIERRRTKNLSRSSEESEQQLQADRIGLFAMVAAGYDGSAFASFFDRLVETKGKTGSWFTDIFGNAKPEEKRLREMIKITDQLPARCRENHQAGVSQEFLKWQADVVSYRDINKKEDLTGLLWKKELSPKLRSDISHFVFSANGQYFLAQDDFAITVIHREPLEVAFQIPAPAAQEATFTPDGQFVVFGTENLRYEKWSVAEKKPVQIRELVVRRDCWEHQFSPDGNYLACVDYGLNLSVLDTQSGKKIWEKKDFYRLSVFELIGWIAARGVDEDTPATHFFNIQFSTDSRLLAVSRSNTFRFRIRVNLMTAAESEDTLLALDLSTLKPLSVGGELKKVTTRPFVFLDANRILGMSSQKPEDSGIFSFPEGKRIARFSLRGEELKKTANPNYVVLKPLADAKLGIFDLSRGTIVAALNKADATFWNQLMVFESVNGKVLLSEVHYDEQQKMLQTKTVGTIEIPAASVGRLYAASVSNNLQWLAISSKTRGAIWSLDSGERKMYVRGFRGALLANDGRGIEDFPKLDPANHSLGIVDALTNQASTLKELPERGARQYGRFLLLREGLKVPKKTDQGKDEDKSDQSQSDDQSSSNAALTKGVSFELRDLVNNKLVWSREFPREAPRFFFDEFSGRLILCWTLGADVGKAKLNEDANLAARAKELGNKDDDYIMEIVDAFAGKTVGTLLLETGKGSFYIRSGLSEGNWLVLHDSNNRILVYSISDGDLRHRFFGSNAAINPAKNQIVVENYPGELTFYDLNTGDSQARLSFGSGTAFVRFSLDGRRLFVLSGDQMAYAFDLDKLTTKAPVQ
jgi:WD40 repeat protein